jgi:hypothetical protein
MEDSLGVVLLYFVCWFGVWFALIQARKTPVRGSVRYIPHARFGFAVRFALGKRRAAGPGKYREHSRHKFSQRMSQKTTNKLEYDSP